MILYLRSNSTSHIFYTSSIFSGLAKCIICNSKLCSVAAQILYDFNAISKACNTTRICTFTHGNFTDIKGQGKILSVMKLDFIFYFRILKEEGGEKSASHNVFTAIYRNLCTVGRAGRGLRVRNLI